MKKVLITLLSLTSLAMALEPKKVLISQVVEHPALDATTQGIIEGLEKNGYKRGENLEIDIESAQDNAGLATQIAAKFVSQKPDVVVGVGTLTAQSFAKYAQAGHVNLAFSTVTDPLSASLIKTIENPGNNTSGVSNFVPLEPQLQLFMKLQPQLKRIGIIYNPGQINSVSIVEKLESACKKMGLILIKQTVAKASDLPQAATTLADQVEAIFISNDNTALSGLQCIIKAAHLTKIPVYVSDTDAVEQGAVAALGPSQYDIGFQTGKMIARSLRGESLGDIPVEFPQKTELYINLDAAQKAGITIPEELKASAIIVIPRRA